MKKSTGKKVAAAAAGAVAAAAAGVAIAKVVKGRQTVIHIEPSGDSWQLMVEGNKKASKVFETKEEAVAAGREMAHGRAPSELVIHRSDGSEQDRHSYEA